MISTRPRAASLNKYFRDDVLRSAQFTLTDTVKALYYEESAVIVSFGDKAAGRLPRHAPRLLKRFPAEVMRRAIVKLDCLAALPISSTSKPPGNRLEGPQGDLRGFHSIRVNDQWRIVFRWQGTDAHDVRLTDYHR
jgi:proteic killer suppression protein